MSDKAQQANSILASLGTLLPDLESVYKDIHSHPELSMQENRAGPVAATLLGMLTGIGGGMVRDILVMEIPNVLRTELYAVAALIGAAVMVLGKMLNLRTSAAATTGAVLCFGLRFIAMRRGWQLPIARPPQKG